MHLILGTAGHIDHGKTALIKALTGIDCDRLEEEKARGITIELGFAYMDLPGAGRVGVVDVPGHERFVRNMVSGAAGIDLVMLVVAADEGGHAPDPGAFGHLPLAGRAPRPGGPDQGGHGGGGPAGAGHRGGARRAGRNLSGGRAPDPGLLAHRPGPGRSARGPGPGGGQGSRTGQGRALPPARGPGLHHEGLRQRDHRHLRGRQPVQGRGRHRLPQRPSGQGARPAEPWPGGRRGPGRAALGREPLGHRPGQAASRPCAGQDRAACSRNCPGKWS